MKTRVVHANDDVPGADYIGRAMPWKPCGLFHNPYKIGKHGDRRDVIRLYRVRMEAVLAGPDGDFLGEHLRELVGKPLACWCRHDGEECTEDTACHGDVLIELIHEIELDHEDPP